MPSLVCLAREGIFDRSYIKWVEFFTPSRILQEGALRVRRCC